MIADIRQPNIRSDAPDNVKLQQMLSYLYQLSGTLSWAFNNIDAGTEEQKVILQQTGTGNKDSGQIDTNTFASIKALIIKSSDIIEAYSEEIRKKLSGEYVSSSEFGNYQQTTSQTIEETSQRTTQIFQNLQEVTNTVNQLYDAQIGVNAYIKTGLLYEDETGVPVYGLEIGQTNDVQGQTVFSKFARFSSDRLSFFDRNDTEVAYISDYKLFITNAEVTNDLRIARKFLITGDEGLAIKWIGG